MEVLKLIGIVIVVIGFLLKKDTLAVIVVAGIATGLVAKMSLMEILDVLGKSFLSQRVATIFVITLPVIGICERYGLREKAVDLIRKVRGATVGRLISIYQVVRTLAAAFSIRLSGHPQFVRPLINPMAQAAAVAKYGHVTDESEDTIKGFCAAGENYGNFYAQNCFMGASGTLLIVTTLVEQGCDVNALQIAMMSIPVAVISVIVGFVHNMILDRRLARQYEKGGK